MSTSAPDWSAPKCDPRGWTPYSPPLRPLSPFVPWLPWHHNITHTSHYRPSNRTLFASPSPTYHEHTFTPIPQDQLSSNSPLRTPKPVPMVCVDDSSAPCMVHWMQQRDGPTTTRPFSNPQALFRVRHHPATSCTPVGGSTLWCMEMILYLWQGAWDGKRR